MSPSQHSRSFINSSAASTTAVSVSSSSPSVTTVGRTKYPVRHDDSDSEDDDSRSSPEYDELEEDHYASVDEDESMPSRGHSPLYPSLRTTVYT